MEPAWAHAQRRLKGCLEDTTVPRSRERDQGRAPVARVVVSPRVAGGTVARRRSTRGLGRGLSSLAVAFVGFMVIGNLVLLGTSVALQVVGPDGTRPPGITGIDHARVVDDKSCGEAAPHPRRATRACWPTASPPSSTCARAPASKSSSRCGRSVSPSSTFPSTTARSSPASIDKLMVVVAASPGRCSSIARPVSGGPAAWSRPTRCARASPRAWVPPWRTWPWSAHPGAARLHRHPRGLERRPPPRPRRDGRPACWMRPEQYIGLFAGAFDYVRIARGASGTQAGHHDGGGGAGGARALEVHGVGELLQGGRPDGQVAPRRHPRPRRCPCAPRRPRPRCRSARHRPGNG